MKISDFSHVSGQAFRVGEVLRDTILNNVQNTVTGHMSFTAIFKVREGRQVFSLLQDVTFEKVGSDSIEILDTVLRRY